MGSIEEFSTDSVPRAARVEYWNRIASETFTALRIDPEDRDSFHARLGRTSIGPLHVAVARSSCARVQRVASHGPRADADGPLFVHLQISGRSRCSQARRQALLEPGDFAVCDASRPYSVELSEENEMLILKLEPGSLGPGFGDPERITGLRFGRDASAAMFATFISEAFRQAPYGQEDPGWRTTVSKTAMDLLSLSLFGCEVDDARAGLRRRAMELIEQRACDAEFDPHALAAALGVTVRYLQMAFAESGTTPSGAIRAARLDMARRRLLDGPGRSITELAFELGFSDSGHFSRAFRSAFGLTPTALRQRRRGAASVEAPDDRVARTV